MDLTYSGEGAGDAGKDTSNPFLECLIRSEFKQRQGLVTHAVLYIVCFICVL